MNHPPAKVQADGDSSPRYFMRLFRVLHAVIQWLNGAADTFTPARCAHDPELSRRARLISRFAFWGIFFGSAYAGFYFLISHHWGVAIVLVCSAGFGVVPWLMRRTGSLTLAGNALSLILILGFTALCFVEGGVEGHAIAWLASVPLCALLLIGPRAARWWVLACFAAVAMIVAFHLAGFQMKPTFGAEWTRLVATSGYLGLVLFMFILGMIFETGREQAFGKMKDALEKLESSNGELVRLNEEKNEFLGIAAHDLKNPLTAIIGGAELLIMRPNSPRSGDIARNIVNAGGRMVALIKNLLDANAIEQGRFSSNLEGCDLRTLVEEAMQHNQSAAGRKGLTLRLETGGAVWTKTDRMAAGQILDNLLSNALKYSPPDKVIHVQLSASLGKVLVAVRDEGPGISAEDQKKLFQKFTRLSARPTAGESSTGLGLSIVKRLTEAIGGTVQCQSTLGLGATFILSLPAWDGPLPVINGTPPHNIISLTATGHEENAEARAAGASLTKAS